MLNALPVFHSFGLTGGHAAADPLRGARPCSIPPRCITGSCRQLAYDTNATILFGTDTFLAGYARAANAYDFYSLRYVFAGAERVREETRRTWSEKFGLRIFEGYGATETAPVIAVNTPMHFKAGTRRPAAPRHRWRLDPVPGIAEGGRLSGPRAQRHARLSQGRGAGRARAAARAAGYDTGDIVTSTPRGFVTILGRAKRFAKIAGEMVSLTAVESAIAALWPDLRPCRRRLPDPRKGEQLLLVTDHAGASREELLAHAREMGLPELFLPRTIIHVEGLPLLGSGKADYKAIAELVREAEPAAANLAV